jgi:hypothetical protein
LIRPSEPVRLDQPSDLGGIIVFIEVGDQHIGALAGDRDRSADAAVAAGDHGAFSGQPT